LGLRRKIIESNDDLAGESPIGLTPASIRLISGFFSAPVKREIEVAHCCIVGVVCCSMLFRQARLLLWLPQRMPTVAAIPICSSIAAIQTPQLAKE
jgi:hypothetical protein